MSGFDLVPMEQMSGENRFLVDEREKLIKTLLQNQNLYIQQVHIEKEITSDYASREILELLQNAADASDRGGEITIELKDSTLYAINDGSPFSKAGIQSILTAYNSSKTADEDIGNKGLGFRALLNRASDIKIYSGNYSFELSAKNAKEYYRTLNPRPPLVPPVLLSPRVIAPRQTAHTTVIEIKLKDQTSRKEIAEMILDIEPEIILFLPHISRINFTIDGETISYLKKQTQKTVKIKKTTSEKTKTYVYEVLKKPFEGSTIIFAYPSERKDTEHFLYNYFSTKDLFPTNWFIHADFDLQSSREHLDHSKKNSQLLKTIIDSLFDHAMSLTRDKQSSWEPLESLLGNYEKFDDTFKIGNQTIREYFEQKLRSLPLLPTVSGAYISFDDQPKYFATELSSCLSGPLFQDYLIYASSEEINHFLATFGAKKPTTKEIVPLLNQYLKTADLDTRIELSIQFLETYQHDFEDAKIQPDFFYEKSGRPIDFRSEKYNEPLVKIENLPKFIDLCFIDHILLEAIQKRLGVTARDFRNHEYSKFYNINEYRLDNIVRTYYRNVSVAPISAKRMENFIIWLFHNYPNRDRIRENCTYLYLPSKTGELISLGDAYFSGSLYERLYQNPANVLKPLESYGISASETVEFQIFLQGLSVADTPRIRHYQTNLPYLPKFQTILKKAAFKDLVELLIMPEYSWLTENEPYRSNLRNTSWLEIGSTKYRPSEIILDEAFGEKFENLHGIGRGKLLASFPLETFPNHSAVSDLIDRLAIRSELSSFDGDVIYKVLLELPKKDPGGRLASKIQKDLGSNLDPSDLDTCADYHSFLEKGKVFCQDKKYHPVSEAYYLDLGRLPDAVLKDKPLLDVYKKTGAERIKTIFGVKKLEVEYYVKDFSPSIANDPFKADLLEVKTAVIASDKIETFDQTSQNLRALQVTLCDRIVISTDDQTFELSDYELATKKDSPSKFYLKVLENYTLSKFRHRSKFLNVLTEIIILTIGTDTVRDKSDSIKVLLHGNPYDEIIEQDDGAENWARAHEFLTGEKPIEGEEEIIERNYNLISPTLLDLEPFFRNYIYQALLSAPLDEKRRYTEKINQLLSWYPAEASRDIFKAPDFNPRSFILKELFMLEELPDLPESDCGKASFEQFYDSLEEECRPIFSHSQELKDLARFGEYEAIRQELSAERAKQQSIESSHLDESSDELEPLKVENATKLEGDVKIIRKETRGSDIYRGNYSGEGGSQKVKIENGKLAQDLAMEILKKAGNRVEDLSSYNERSPDASDSTGYDLRYIDQNGLVHCVEVKSSQSYSNRIDFTISRNEHNTAEQISKLGNHIFEIFYVNGTRSAKQNYWQTTWAEIKELLEPEEPRKYEFHCTI